MREVRPEDHRRFLYRDGAELRRDISKLGLSVPWEEDLGILLTPISVGDRVLPNRLAVHPMEGFDALSDGGPGELTFRRYRRFGSGGAGLLWFEATAVAEGGRSNPHQLLLNEHNLRRFSDLVTATREAAVERPGFGPDRMLVLQLTHSGRWSRPGGFRNPLLAHHVAVLDDLVGVDDAYPLVRDEELDRLQDVFVGAARLAAAAGFDGVDVKACHGYLVSELLGAFTRGGRYGGGLENRARFLLETVERIRAEVPDVFVTTRLNVYDGIPRPGGFGMAGDGSADPDLTEPVALLGRLKELGIPMANITLGVPYRAPHLGRPFNRGVPGSTPATEHPLVGIARFQELTGRLQKALPDLPLVGTGYSWLRHFFPYVGAGALREGRVSVVGVGRMAFAYPDFAGDLLEHGALDPRKVCVGCSGCSQLMKLGRSSGCVVRDGEIYHLPRQHDGVDRLPRKEPGEGPGREEGRGCGP